MSALLPLLEAPSEEESENYYRGLSPCPRLVGRTSAGVRPWAGIPNHGLDWLDPRYDSDPAQCIVTPIGGRHRALEKIERGLPQIMRALNVLPWTCIDLLRIGSSKVPMMERPVVLWVGVATKDDKGAPLSLKWENIEQALRQVRDVLDHMGLPEVECEIREADCVPLAGPPLSAPVLEGEETYPWEAMTKRGLSTAIGQVMVSSDKSVEGTLGVYVCPRNKTPQHTPLPLPLWALTCRHVCLPPAEHSSDYYCERDPNRQALALFSPSDRVLQEAAGRVQRILTMDSLSPQQAAAARKTLSDLQSLRSWDNRKIGSVFLAPPIAPQLSPDGQKHWTRDWALVDLVRAKFPQAHTRNEVDLRDDSPWIFAQDTLLNWMHESCELPAGFQLPKNGILPIRGVVPMAELEWLSSGRADGPAPFWYPTQNDSSNPAHAHQEAEEAKRLKDHQKGRMLVVGKRGSQTGLTWGVAAEFLSVTRTLSSGAAPSHELAIIGSVENGTVPFSQPGDSGAVVFDVTGRAVGLLTAGTLSGADISYCSPMELVMADVAKEVGEEVVLL